MTDKKAKRGSASNTKEVGTGVTVWAKLHFGHIANLETPWKQREQ
jgi:hypothetical protein